MALGARDVSRLADVQRFYEILSALRASVGERRLRDCDGLMPWPLGGVYFFFEDGEERSASGTGPRVVRVGTHGLTRRSSSTLWSRLSQHRGVAGSGGGNHRGSIFRLLVGEALLRKQRAEHSSWGRKESLGAAASYLDLSREAVQEQEAPIERQVSQVIGAMPITWLRVEDPPGLGSERGYVERNSIALLSNAGRDAVDLPSADWLGLHSGREAVRSSGLWNSNHVGEVHDAGFLGRLESIGEPDRGSCITDEMP